MKVKVRRRKRAFTYTKPVRDGFWIRVFHRPYQWVPADETEGFKLKSQPRMEFFYHRPLIHACSSFGTWEISEARFGAKICAGPTKKDALKEMKRLFTLFEKKGRTQDKIMIGMAKNSILSPRYSTETSPKGIKKPFIKKTEKQKVKVRVRKRKRNAATSR